MPVSSSLSVTPNRHFCVSNSRLLSFQLGSTGRKGSAMCHFANSKDVYTDCLLWEKAPDEASASKPDENATSHFHLPKLLRILHDNFRTENAPVAEASATAGAVNTLLPVEQQLAVHVIKQKTIFQCQAARDNPELAPAEDDRYCPDAQETQMKDGAQVKEPTSQYQGTPCPVCEAAKAAVVKQLDCTEVVRTLYTVYSLMLILSRCLLRRKALPH